MGRRCAACRQEEADQRRSLPHRIDDGASPTASTPRRHGRERRGRVFLDDAPLRARSRRRHRRERGAVLRGLHAVSDGSLHGLLFSTAVRASRPLTPPPPSPPDIRLVIGTARTRGQARSKIQPDSAGPAPAWVARRCRRRRRLRRARAPPRPLPRPPLQPAAARGPRRPDAARPLRSRHPRAPVPRRRRRARRPLRRHRDAQGLHRQRPVVREHRLRGAARPRRHRHHRLAAPAFGRAVGRP